ncbi:multicopper oxidase [Amylolactobacillus amylotrophicus DSM 20534]|uniref:Multicopper oxidase n=3 Tax=Amylolactobacillus TaxID=2767876 RepID=A0A0R1YQ10_9LACO|nr:MULTISPECIES: multicopper oxidase domain-containing protein [Amylolactobacillus]APT18323.1 copper oxidase [Amylolactobacillus amylophilus DSM 20533 = JCM 1125]KRK38108.1 multicopper oxidase [Amylolactobacillus amylotrophicus DSM 20534]KRM41993.1 multicopper oxidase [Amylolactobacillus amylophilus DSM 20533 = JCM 1125]GED81012.1 multicopper oxidase [Amylolactobacillus amylophilus]
MENKINTDYFFDEAAFNTHDGGYVPLEVYDAPEVPLAIPPLLEPDQETATDAYYTVEAQAGETQILPGAKTKTWGYNASLLGKTIVYHVGKHNHVTLKNSLPELTTFHWHGLGVSGPYIDGGCHAPVYPGEESKIEFTLHQPAATTWLHAHPCPSTAEQVWHGLATMVIVKDEHEESLPLPRNYGVDDIPLVLQDRRFHENNQWDYREDYDPDGVQGPTALINGTVNPYFDVTTQKLRLRILDGANRREWRLHFSDNLEFTQIAGDSSLLPEPVKFTKLMLTCAERAEIIVDFKDYKEGDVVTLFSDDVPIVRFRIHDFTPDNTVVPDKLIDLPKEEADPDLPVRAILMSGMDEEVMLNGKKFNMQRIDATQPVGKAQYWDITNSNDMVGGMVHPFHVHGTEFLVISRNGHEPYANEHGYKDTVGVNPGETVRILVRFAQTGVYMYHCHIIEHEDGGMMAQIQSYDPAEKELKKYKLMDMDTLMNAFAEERGIKTEELWMAGMESYEKMGMEM